MAEKQTINFGRELEKWKVPEYEKHDRSRRWYITAIIVFLLFLLYAFVTADFLFAVILIVSGLIMVLHDGKDPEMVNFIITTEGVIIGRKFYDYDEIKNFSIVYKPSFGVKKLYFEFKNALTPRLTVPLLDMNPLPIRENLLKYIPEDLERTNEPLSEALAKLFKL